MKNMFTNNQICLLLTMTEKEFDRLQQKLLLNHYSERSEFKNVEEIKQLLITLQEIEEKINE